MSALEEIPPPEELVSDEIVEAARVVCQVLRPGHERLVVNLAGMLHPVMLMDPRETVVMAAFVVLQLRDAGFLILDEEEQADG